MKRLSKLVIAILIQLVVAQITFGNLTKNGSFETLVDTTSLPPPIHYPSDYGYWTGDAVMSVGATSGIIPFDGSQMLSFLYTESALYPDSGGIQSTIAQLIDISSYLPAIAQRDGQAHMSALFNRVAGDSQTDTQFIMQLYAFSGDYGTLQEQITTGQELGFATANIFTDSNPATWELLELDFLLPDNTTFIAALLHARENIFDDNGAGEFDGHFVDMVSVEVIPVPGAIILGGIGLGFVGVLRRRKAI